jgi:hypothetical protein
MLGRGPRDETLRISQHVVFRDLEGEMVLLNLASGVYFGLDPVGTRIWRLIAEHRSVAEIADTLTAEYEVDAAICRADLERFLVTLADNELLHMSDGAPR